MDFLKRIYHKTRKRLGFRNKSDDIKLGRATPKYRPNNELDAEAEEPKRSWFQMMSNRSLSPRTRRSSQRSSKGWMSRIASTLKAPFRKKRPHYEENFGGRKSKRRRRRR